MCCLYKFMFRVYFGYVKNHSCNQILRAKDISRGPQKSISTRQFCNEFIDRLHHLDNTDNIQ